MGEYVVIDVDTKHYFVDSDSLVALEKAKKKYPDKIFFSVIVGSLNSTTINFRKNQSYAWTF